MRLTILHCYPDHMNLYGDRGNVLSLVQRAKWRGIPSEVVACQVGDRIDWRGVNLIFMGGGEDRHQAQIAQDLLARRADLVSALNDGVPMLAICGAYQLMGRWYRPGVGDTLPGLEYFDVWTIAQNARAIGNVAAEIMLPVSPKTLVGFENHGGQTFFGDSAQPFARVVAGHGNNGQDGWEGVVRAHAIGTYLHGPLLPKNPHLADMLLEWALGRPLSPLPDDLEWQAHQTIYHRVVKLGGRDAV